MFTTIQSIKNAQTAPHYVVYFLPAEKRKKISFYVIIQTHTNKEYSSVLSFVFTDSHSIIAFLKVHLHEIFDFCFFFHQKHPFGPLINTLNSFRI